jgi:hypothetical protein
MATTRSSSVKTTQPPTKGVQIFTSSEARRQWKNVTTRALAGEKIAILIGKRAVALRPVELTYAEEEYQVTESELHDKAQKVLGRARKERAQGKTGSGSNLL